MKRKLFLYAWEDNTMEGTDRCDYDMNDYYMLHVSTAGTDPHCIVIPGKWQWPTERTRINEAYLEFNTWAADHTKAKDWYLHPVKGKTVVR